MFTLNITKQYTVNRPVTETVGQLNAIISAPFNNSHYSTFGSFISVDPPGFELGMKGGSIFKPGITVSTKLYVEVFASGTQSKIIATTQTNPGVFIVSGLFIIFFLIRLITSHNGNEAGQAAIYFLLALGAFGLDRFKKNILIASFERDLKTFK